MEVWKERIQELFEKEACCPACHKARRDNPLISDELKARIKDPSASGQMPPCFGHKGVRLNMSVSGMKTWS